MYLDWQTEAIDYYAVDIECESLTPSIIWVMCWENIRDGTKKGHCIGYDQIREFFTKTKGSIYVGHNILKFDGPVLNRLAGTSLSVHSLIDTLVLCTLYNPSLNGGHSLGAWGTRIGFEKDSFNDWGNLSDEMIAYCYQDVKVTAELFRRTTKVLNKIGFSELSCYIQHHITAILFQQETNGFCFARERAVKLLEELRVIAKSLEDQVQKLFPAERKYVATRQIRKKNGEYTKIYLEDLERYIVQPSNEPNKYIAFEDVEFNLGSPSQRVAKLLELGWEPEEFTPKTDKGGGGNPKPFDKGDLSPSLAKFVEENPVPEVKMIASWMSITGRINMISNWLDNLDESTGRIHGKVFVANTLRFTHNSPNTANIPAVRQDKQGNPVLGLEGFYTYESRDLWTARPGRVLVGTDAAGLELRMLAHYINRPEFTAGIVGGDPHQSNADLAGVTRPQAKTMIYAILYGAQGPKIGRTLGISSKEGSILRQQFLDRLGLSSVMNDAMNEQKAGRIWLVDGSGVISPSPHSALNYKLQGGGARVMALASIIFDGYIKEYGLDSLKVGDIHDEWVYDVALQDAEEHRRLSLLSLKEAGEQLKLNVPIDGNALIGPTWAHVH